MYVAVGRHTLIPSALLLALQIPVYFGYFLLCSRLSSKYQNVDSKEHRPSVTTLVSQVSDTGKQDTENANNMLCTSEVQKENAKDISLNKQLETIVQNISDISVTNCCETVDAKF